MELTDVWSCRGWLVFLLCLGWLWVFDVLFGCLFGFVLFVFTVFPIHRAFAPKM